MIDSDRKAATASGREWRGLLIAGRGGIARACDYVVALGRRNYEHVEPNLIPIAILGVIAFPAYYVVWAHLFPQRYESLSLRLIGVVFCLLLALKNYWPKSLVRFQRAFFLVLLLYCLPFFFTYMMLMNAASTVWLLSTLAALFLLVLLVDWVNLLLLFGAGSSLAWLAYVLTETDTVQADVYFEYFPIFVFAVVAGMIFNYKTEMIRHERIRAVGEAIANMSSELRRPLQMTRTGAVSLAKYLPLLTCGFEAARDEGLEVPVVVAEHLEAIADLPSRIEGEMDHASAIIDMAMVATESEALGDVPLAPYRMGPCVEEALRMYPFRSERERARVVWRRDVDFAFVGSRRLVIRVLLQLIRSGLNSVAAKGRGELVISGREEGGCNTLVVRDTGVGIPKHALPRIFNDPYSYDFDLNRIAGGFGYCRKVIERFGGSFEVVSEIGSPTRITLRFPEIADPAPRIADGRLSSEGVGSVA